MLDGCGDCSPICLHRSDLTSLLPHVPGRSLVYQVRDASDIALVDSEHACPFADGELEPDATPLPNGFALSLYQVDRSIETLRLEKVGATIRFRF